MKHTNEVNTVLCMEHTDEVNAKCTCMERINEVNTVFINETHSQSVYTTFECYVCNIFLNDTLFSCLVHDNKWYTNFNVFKSKTNITHFLCKERMYV